MKLNALFESTKTVIDVVQPSSVWRPKLDEFGVNFAGVMLSGFENFQVQGQMVWLIQPGEITGIKTPGEVQPISFPDNALLARKIKKAVSTKNSEIRQIIKSGGRPAGMEWVEDEHDLLEMFDEYFQQCVDFYDEIKLHILFIEYFGNVPRSRLKTFMRYVFTMRVIEEFGMQTAFAGKNL